MANFDGDSRDASSFTPKIVKAIEFDCCCLGFQPRFPCTHSLDPNLCVSLCICAQSLANPFVLCRALSFAPFFFFFFFRVHCTHTRSVLCVSLSMLLHTKPNFNAATHRIQWIQFIRFWVQVHQVYLLVHSFAQLSSSLLPVRLFAFTTVCLSIQFIAMWWLALHWFATPIVSTLASDLSENLLPPHQNRFRYDCHFKMLIMYPAISSCRLDYFQLWIAVHPKGLTFHRFLHVIIRYEGCRTHNGYKAKQWTMHT